MCRCRNIKIRPRRHSNRGKYGSRSHIFHRGPEKTGEPRKGGNISVSRDLAPLRTFLFLGRRAFYSDGKTHYSQAWALVHFLRNGDEKYRSLFRNLMSELKKGTPSRQALKATFEDGVDLDALDRAFRAHVRGL